MSVCQLQSELLSPPVADCKNQFSVDIGVKEAERVFTVNDWSRISYVHSLIPDKGSVLDVGTGQGHFVNALSKSTKIERLATIDIKTSQRFFKHGEYEQYKMSVSDMKFECEEFDTVVCMEVIEHLKDEDFENAIPELRRVTKSKLIVTVPFCEPEPLPKYHHQSFSIDRIKKLFPNATFTLLMKKPVTRVPWLLVCETKTSKKNKIFSKWF